MSYKNELLILYNSYDEEVFKHIKSLIKTKDDSKDKIVGVKDNSVIVFKGLASDYDRFKYSADKFLFIDCAPVESIKKQLFSRYGVSYGTIDKDHMYVDIDNAYRWERKNYDSFLGELRELIENPISEMDALKKTERNSSTANKALRLVSLAVLPPLGVTLYAVNANTKAQTKELHRKQLLYYGITKLYYDDMDSLVNG